MQVNFNDLMMAFEFVSDVAPFEHEAYICPESGRIHWYSEISDMGDDDMPDDLDSGKYLSIPHKNELDLGKKLVLRFAQEQMPDAIDEVERIFSRRGAYVHFKHLLGHRGALQQWYDYEEQATKEALREWCALEGIEIAE